MYSNIIAQSTDIFQMAKDPPFPKVFQEFHGGEVEHNKSGCPFHSEKTPSFHIYENGFFCFGCGESGDNISFVAKLNNLRPIDAAKAIVERFHIPIVDKPLSRRDKLRIAQAKAERLREKHLQEAFENWVRKAGRNVRILAEAIRSLLEEKGLEIENDIVPLIHKLPIFEYWADVLAEGTDDEKLLLYRDKDFRRWF